MEKTFRVVCDTDKVASLTKGKEYEAKYDKNGQLRVKDDNGRWSKFSKKNFRFFDDVDTADVEEASVSEPISLPEDYNFATHKELSKSFLNVIGEENLSKLVGMKVISISNHCGIRRGETYTIKNVKADILEVSDSSKYPFVEFEGVTPEATFISRVIPADGRSWGDVIEEIKHLPKRSAEEADKLTDYIIRGSASVEKLDEFLKGKELVLVSDPPEPYCYSTEEKILPGDKVTVERVYDASGHPFVRFKHPKVGVTVVSMIGRFDPVGMTWDDVIEACGKLEDTPVESPVRSEEEVITLSKELLEKLDLDKANEKLKGAKFRLMSKPYEYVTCGLKTGDVVTAKAFVLGAVGSLHIDFVTDGKKSYKWLIGRFDHASLSWEEILKYCGKTTEAEGTSIRSERKLKGESAEVKEESESEKSESKGVVKEMKKMSLREYLESQGVPSKMVDDIAHFRKEYQLDGTSPVVDRLVKPHTLFQGKAVWTAAIAAILEGQHILLEGEKATGKNVLCENLAFVFGRPLWDVSFHVNTDASSLIGSETFKNNEVQFRPGAVYEVAQHGGFGVLDEINMAKNEAISILHSITDDRRVIDVPGYERIKLHPATRFIGTMNYGYAGTRELNEALVSRFVVIQVPALDEMELTKLLKSKFPAADDEKLLLFAGLFQDLQRKAKDAEISTKSVDLRGIISALKLIQRGVKPLDAVMVSVVNKAFDQFERNIVKDTVGTRIRGAWNPEDIFPTATSMKIDFSSVGV